MKIDQALIIPNRITYCGVMLIFFIWLFTGTCSYWFAADDSVPATDFNAISWATAALAALWLVVRLPANVMRPIAAVPSLRLMLPGAILWSLSLLWATSSITVAKGLPHVLGLWALLGLLWLLRRLPLSRRQRLGVLLMLAAAELFQVPLLFTRLTLFRGGSAVDGMYSWMPLNATGLFQLTRLPALAGLLLMATAILRSLWSRGGWRWQGLVLLLPVMVNSNPEYPDIFSVPDGLVLVLLLNVVLAPASFVPLANGAKSIFGFLPDVVIRAVITVICTAVLAWMAATLLQAGRVSDSNYFWLLF
ncbi:hypothetical protein [Pluralibacter gergoviae]|uniref:hypothetical protein n=1 Tax=Pluralibacter gergoviae TaxID=61647 RepID=UPI0011857BDB|nr:hypothetical protein [Pluralibacter gergoviae]